MQAQAHCGPQETGFLNELELNQILARSLLGHTCWLQATDLMGAATRWGEVINGGGGAARS